MAPDAYYSLRLLESTGKKKNKTKQNKTQKKKIEQTLFFSSCRFIDFSLLFKGIVVVPGSGFGQADGTFHFRTFFWQNIKTNMQTYRAREEKNLF